MHSRTKEGRAIRRWLENTLRENGAIGRLQGEVEQMSLPDQDRNIAEPINEEIRHRRYSGFPEGVVNLPTIHEEPEDSGEGPSLPVKFRYPNRFADGGYMSMESRKTWPVTHEDEADDDSLLQKKRVLAPLPPYH